MIGTEPDFNKQSQNGLIPAVIVDAETKAFLMLGYKQRKLFINQKYWANLVLVS